MWQKQQILTLKKTAYAHCADDDIQQHLTALNLHLNKYESLPLIHQKNEKWKEVEWEADQIKARLVLLNVELPSLR